MKGDANKSRIKSWYKYFSEDKESVISKSEEESIPPSFEHLDIKTSAFTTKAPKVIKRCDLDVIILKYANNFPVNNEKP